MGCKQCRILLRKQDSHSINIQQNSTSHPRSLNSSNEISQQSQKQIKFTTLDFPLLPKLDNLPVELIYHILDRLDTNTILTSLYNVSSHFNSIIRTYDKFELNLNSITMHYFNRICSLIRPEQIRSLTLSDGSDNVGLVRLFLKKFPMESFKYLQSLRLINIDNNEYMIKIFLTMTDQLKMLTIQNSNERYNDTFIDILMISIGNRFLEKLSLHIEKNRFLHTTVLWPNECFLKEINLIGVCHISSFRNILKNSPYLRKFQTYDIDLDDEWIDNDDEDEDDDNETNRQSHMILIPNASNLISLSLINARNEMEKIEWLLKQFTQLKYFKYFNIYDRHSDSIYDTDYLFLDGKRWEKLVFNCEKFEFIFTHRIDDESWDIDEYLTKFQSNFWKDKNWKVGFEQYDKILLVYSLPYPHDTHYYDRSILLSLPHNTILLTKSFENVRKLRINITAVANLGKRITGPSRFPNVDHLILDGRWRHVDTIDSISSLVCLSNIVKLVRLERVPTLIFRTFVYCLMNLESLILTPNVLDGMNAAFFQYLRCLNSINIVQSDDDYRHYVNVEPFCTMFPQIKHLDIPIDNLDSCQYVIDHLEKFLISVVFRFPRNDDDDEDDEYDNEKNDELIEWTQNLRENHQYRIRDGDIYIWFK